MTAPGSRFPGAFLWSALDHLVELAERDRVAHHRLEHLHRAVGAMHRHDDVVAELVVARAEEPRRVRGGIERGEEGDEAAAGRETEARRDRVVQLGDAVLEHVLSSAPYARAECRKNSRERTACCATSRSWRLGSVQEKKRHGAPELDDNFYALATLSR